MSLSVMAFCCRCRVKRRWERECEGVDLSCCCCFIVFLGLNWLCRFPKRQSMFSDIKGLLHKLLQKNCCQVNGSELFLILT